MKILARIIGVGALCMAQGAFLGAQAAPGALTIGENTRLNANALLTAGYSGDYGDAISSDHGLTFGLDGKLEGFYYSPNFLSFTAAPYYNQSRNDSSYQSLTGASGIDGTANFFTGSNFPGAVSYRYDRNSTGTFGLTGQPNFTTIGKGEGFAVNWSALLPNWPTLSVGYSQGSGGGTIYGTSEETHSTNRIFNLRSGYQIAGFRLNAFFDHNSNHSTFPQFLTGDSESIQTSTSHDIGVGAQHSLPLRGTFYTSFDRTTSDSNYFSSAGESSNTSSYTDNLENAGASFHPTQKFSFNLNENYTGNLSGYLTQSLTSSGGPVPQINLGSGSHSITMGGGASYEITNFLTTSAVATHYDQFYFGHDYTGTFLSGTLNYGKRILDLFTVSAGVVDSSNGLGSNSVGFTGNLNFFHQFGAWATTANFTYAQNVQSILITYTTSSYSYGANVHRKIPGGWQWTTGFNGSHSGLTQQQGSDSHSEGFSTSVSSRRFSVNGLYSQSTGISLLGLSGLQGVPPTPGVTDFIAFSGSNYGGGFSVQPLRRLILSGSFSRSISNTLGQTDSHNNTEVFNAQMQYHLRRISLQAGYTRFDQGVSALGAPQSTTNYFVGFSRWFNFF